jgi:hypothetical protein
MAQLDTQGECTACDKKHRFRIREGTIHVNSVAIQDPVSAFHKIGMDRGIDVEGFVSFPDSCLLVSSTKRVTIGKNRVNARDLMCALFKRDLAKHEGCNLVHAVMVGDSGALYMRSEDRVPSRGTKEPVCINPAHMGYKCVVRVTNVLPNEQAGYTKKREYEMLVRGGLSHDAASAICDISKQWSREIKRKRPYEHREQVVEPPHGKRQRVPEW